VKRSQATGLGLVALVLWSTTIAVSRSLEEQLGPMSSAAGMYLGGAVLALLFETWRGDGIRAALSLPQRYLWGCGGLFALYAVSLYLAIGGAVDRRQIQEVTLLNYLWPGLTLAFSIPILRHRAHPLFPVGLVCALWGVALVVFKGQFGAWSGVIATLRTHPLPYIGGLVAGISWALFSNLSRKWAGNRRGNAAPIFFLVTGLILGGLSLARGETSNWTPRAVVELGYGIIFPTFLAYCFWETGVRRGNIVLLGACSNLAPLMATVLNSWYLRIPLHWTVGVGSLLIMVGAWVSRQTLRAPREDRGLAE
jgi:drug/metabolite transporter (DMT)-like permease